MLHLMQHFSSVFRNYVFERLFVFLYPFFTYNNIKNIKMAPISVDLPSPKSMPLTRVLPPLCLILYIQYSNTV